MKRIILFISIILLLIPSLVFAVETLPYSTTFNCSDYNGQAPWTTCDNIQQNGSFRTHCGQYSVINADGNMAAGGGGKGYRMLVNDGGNQQGDIFYVNHNCVNEIWYRMYLRWPLGFAWADGGAGAGIVVYEKIFYPLGSFAGPTVFGFGTGNHTIGLVHGSPQQTFYNHSYGWSDMHGGDTADGNWHCLEIYMNNSAGLVKVWIDNTLVLDGTGIQYDGNFCSMRFMENQANPGNGGCVYIDIDDIAISATGRIGPLGPIPPEHTIIIWSQNVGEKN